MQAAVAHAVATEACRVIDAEVAGTRRRLRALTNRWVPRLQDALQTLDQQLEETERAEFIRMRWAVGPGRDTVGS